MKEFETIVCKVEDEVAKVILNRPEVHNAFNDVMIKELIEAFKSIEKKPKIRVVILTGEGKSYCAGADINWIRKTKGYSFEENFNDFIKLSELLYIIYSLPKPVIGRINGTAIGGGTGFVAICDIAISSLQAKFGFSEVKIGLIPACISPYVVKKCGEGKVRELFLTGERITAEKALNIGLVNKVVPHEELDSAIDELVKQLLSGGPNALRMCKELLKEIPNLSLEEAKKYTAQLLTELRLSPEGQEGTTAFLEKRKPNWIQSKTS
jgi:methylglutaconyl-CoA hydratase